MGRFVEGEDRRQQTMLPACLEDYLANDNPVRVVDAFMRAYKSGKVATRKERPISILMSKKIDTEL